MKKSDSVADISTTPRVAIFTGDDTIGREKVRSEILSSIYRLFPDATEERFDSSKEHFEQFATRIITPSLFQTVRIFHVGHANQLSAAETEELNRVARYDVPDVYLIIDCDDDKPKKDKAAKGRASLDIKGAVKASGGRCAHFDFARPAEYKIPEWLAGQVPRLFSRTITREDAAYLVESVGSDLDVLYSELQKLDIHLPPSAPIDRTAIDAVITDTRSQTAFELARALGNRDLAQALDILDSLFASTVYVPLLTSALFRHFWGLLRIRAWAKANQDTMRRYLKKSLGYEAQGTVAHEIGVAAGLLRSGDPVKKAYPVVTLSRVVEQAQSFDTADLDDIIMRLRDFDVDMKTGRADADKSTLQLLCYRIARAGKDREGR